MIKVSAPAKVHLLGEWSVVWGKPALLTTVDLRISVTVIASRAKQSHDLRKIIEPIIKKELKIKKIPPYSLKIESDIPTGAHLGSSAAVSVASVAALLSFLKIKWDLDLINRLAYEAEKVFHGNPSGADNSTIVYGGLMWYRKETGDLKIIQKLPFSVPYKLSKNFILINTGTPKKTTKQMIERVSIKYKVLSIKYKKLFDHQEQLVKELLTAIKDGNEKELIRIIRAGERNLESIGVCSLAVAKIIRKIEAAGGAAKICGAGATDGPTGVLLCYHQDRRVIEKIASENKLNYFSAKLGVEGVKQE
ncbi:hypothetical protein HYU96_02650 [Candidatus Daviesbacteria bacterium]|nr:hypothetical protein [Candidatus Daviesbacteria bacterium]